MHVALAIGTLVILSAGAWPAHAQAQATRVVTPQERRWQADRLFDEGRYDEARDAYLAIYADFAADAEFNRGLGLAFYRARTPDLLKAIQYWTLSWQIDGKEDLKLEAARAYGRLGQWRRGTALLVDLAAAHPQHPEHWRDAAEIAESVHEYTQAEEWYRTYLARRPADAIARLALARILGWTKRYIEAVGEFTRVLETNPRNTPARLGVAQVLAWKGDLDESLRRYDEVLREQPAHVEAQKGKAFALLWSGRWQEARPLFERVARRRPADAEVRAGLEETVRLEQVAAGEAASVAAAPVGRDAVGARIDEAFERGDGRAALALIGQALADAPGDRLLRRRLAQAHLLAGEADAATTVLDTLRAEQPEDADVLRELAQAQLRGSKLADATDTLFAYLVLRPDDQATRVDVARVLSWSRRFDEATREYQRVLSADPDNVLCQVGLAQVVAWQGDHAAAITQFERILERHPDQREALIGRAQAMFWTGRRAEALAQFTAMQFQFPDDREIAALLDDLRDADRRQTLAAMDTESSIRYHEGLLAGRPDDGELLQTLGNLYVRAQDHDKAADAYRRALALRPGDVETQLALARALTAGRRYPEAILTLQDVVGRQPTPRSRRELAQTLTAARDYVRAAAEYRRLIEDEPGDVEARLELARILSWHREYDASIAAYDEIIALDPDRRDVRVERARVLSWKGDLDDALASYAVLEAQYPNDRDVLLGKGQSLQWSGRTREAYRVLQPLVAAYPDDRDIRVAMAGTQLALGRGDLALRELQIAGAGVLEDRDVQTMRNIALRQLRPVLTLSFGPSRDSDDLKIFPGQATLSFSAFPRLRSYLRGALVPSELPTAGRARAREAVFGSTAHLAPGVIARGEIGANVGVDRRTDVIGGAGLTLQPSGDLRLEVDAGRQFINYLPVAFERHISRVLLRAAADYRPGGRTLVHLDYFHGRYSDGNRANGGNAILSRTLVQRAGFVLEAGYLYTLSGFAEDPGNGYYAPSRLQRHAGLVNAYGRATRWLGYSVAGTAGAEQTLDAASDDAYRPDGSIRVSLDFFVGQRVRVSLGYGYSRVASLARAGAYDSHTLTSGLEIGF